MMTDCATASTAISRKETGNSQCAHLVWKMAQQRRRFRRGYSMLRWYVSGKSSSETKNPIAAMITGYHSPA